MVELSWWGINEKKKQVKPEQKVPASHVTEPVKHC